MGHSKMTSLDKMKILRVAKDTMKKNTEIIIFCFLKQHSGDLKSDHFKSVTFVIREVGNVARECQQAKF